MIYPRHTHWARTLAEVGTAALKNAGHTTPPNRTGSPSGHAGQTLKYLIIQRI